MALSEIRVNTTKTRTGVGTITYTETGPVITGIATASNFKTGSTNVHSTGVELANINTGGSTATFGGPISGTTASFSGTVSIGGTLTYEDVTNIDSVGIITARSTVSIGDSINHIGDTDTAIRFPSANTITAETGGTEKLRIDSSGRMGLGTNNPGLYSNLADKVVLRTTGNTGMTLRSGSSSTGSILFASADNSSSNEGIFQYKHSDKAFEFNNYGGGAEKFIYKIQGNEKLRIGSVGNIGINTTVPSTNQDLTFDGASNYKAGILYKQAGVNQYRFMCEGGTGNVYYDTYVNNRDHIFRVDTQSTGGTEVFRIKGEGKVNIGGDFTQTTYPLNVVGSTNGTGQISIVQRLRFSGNSDSYNTGTVIAFTNTSSNANAYSYVGARIDKGAAGDNANALVFATNATNTAPTEKLRITSAGDVAIGKDSAQANYAAGNDTTRLAVVKSSAGSGYHEVAHFTAGSDSNDTGAILRITQYSNDRGLYIKAGRGTSDQAKAIIGLRNSSASDQNIMYFKQGGNVGIGADDPEYMMHLKGGVPALCMTDTDGTHGNSIVESNGDNLKIRCDAGNASSGTGSNISLEVDSFQKMKIHGQHTGSIDVKGIPANLRLYSTRDTSDWDAGDEIGKLEFYVGDDASNNLPYTTNFIKSINTANDKNEPDGALVFGTTGFNQSGGAQETMRLTHDSGYTDRAHLQTQGIGAIRDVYNMMNIRPDGVTFDYVSNNSDGGGTTWEIQNGTTIRLYNTSGGHGGKWGREVLIRQDGWYYWRMCVRVTTTCTAIHGSTPTTKYKYPIGFYFNMGTSGNANGCTIRLWQEFATTGTCNGSQSGTGSLTDGTYVTKTGYPTYLTKGVYQPQYHTNGYQGVRELNIYSLELVMSGAPTNGYENNGTY